MNLIDIFRNNSFEETIREISLEEKIEILGLSDERVEKIRNMPVKQIDYDSESIYIKVLEEIEVDNIVGVARPISAENWLDMLSEEYCHKRRNFEKYDKDKFDVLLQQKTLDGYPSVVGYQNEYYIDGNGLHRLTIAKCLGNKKAKVIVKRVKNLHQI